MREDDAAAPAGTVDPAAMYRFGVWMTRGSTTDSAKVFQDIANGDELGGLALASLCDLELNSAFEEVSGESEFFDGWFSLDEVTTYFEKTGSEHDVRFLVGTLVALASEGLVVMRSESATYRGGHVGSKVAFRVNWPFVLDSWDRALDRMFRPDGHVYLLGGNEFYRIGRTKDVDTRVKQLSRDLPWPTELEHAFPCEGYAEAEKALHEMYAGYRSNGGWYRLPMEAVAYIKSIKRMRGAYIEPLEKAPIYTEALVPSRVQPGAREPKPGETHEHKHCKVEEGFALENPQWRQALPYTFAETEWEAEQRFWTAHPEAAANRAAFVLCNAVRVTDTYVDYRVAGDPRHVYSWQEWERRKAKGIDMYN